MASSSMSGIVVENYFTMVGRRDFKNQSMRSGSSSLNFAKVALSMPLMDAIYDMCGCGFPSCGTMFDSNIMTDMYLE